MVFATNQAWYTTLPKYLINNRVSGVLLVNKADKKIVETKGIQMRKNMSRLPVMYIQI